MSTLDNTNDKSPSSSPRSTEKDLSNLYFTFTIADHSSSGSTEPSSTRPKTNTKEELNSLELSSALSNKVAASQPTATKQDSPTKQDTPSSTSSFFSLLFRSKNEELRALETKFKEIYPQGEISASRFGLRFTADINDSKSPSFSHTRYRSPLAWAGTHTATALLGYAAYGLYMAAPPFGLLTCAGICAAGWLCTTRPAAEYQLTSRMIANCSGSRARAKLDPSGALWAHTKADVLAS
jgi:hypothetical protein